MSHVEEVVKLRARVEELEALVKMMRDSDCVVIDRFRALGLTETERRIVSKLYEASPHVVPYPVLLTCVGKTKGLLNMTYPDSTLKVMVHKIRRKLALIGVEIPCAHGEGFYLPAESKARIDGVIGDSNAS